MLQGGHEDEGGTFRSQAGGESLCPAVGGGDLFCGVCGHLPLAGQSGRRDFRPGLCGQAHRHPHRLSWGYLHALQANQGKWRGLKLCLLHGSYHMICIIHAAYDILHL